MLRREVFLGMPMEIITTKYIVYQVLNPPFSLATKLCRYSKILGQAPSSNLKVFRISCQTLRKAGSFFNLLADFTFFAVVILTQNWNHLNPDFPAL